MFGSWRLLSGFSLEELSQLTTVKESRISLEIPLLPGALVGDELASYQICTQDDPPSI